jgi:DNA invertase Pin-like site-specific DNA recombinase
MIKCNIGGTTLKRRSGSASEYKCVLYLRQSNTRDGSDSIEIQEKVCRQYCRDKRIKIKRIHKETNQRARLMMNKKTLNYISQRLKPGQNLIISKVDRLSRHVAKALEYCRRLRENGNNIISVNEGINFIDNPIKFKRLLIHAEEFSNNKSTEQLVICRALARKGWHFGHAEFGYKVHFNNRNTRKIIKCQEEQEIISFILTYVNAGYSHALISDKLNGSGVKNREKPWNAISIGYVARCANKRIHALQREFFRCREKSATHECPSDRDCVAG